MESVSSSSHRGLLTAVICILAGVMAVTPSHASSRWKGLWQRSHPVITPSKVGGALSVRSPNTDITKLTDYEISVESSWPVGVLEIVWERENGVHQWGYSFHAERQDEDSLWRIQFLSIKKTAQDIERQILSVDREWARQFWAGIGIAAEDFSHPAGVITAEVPLPGSGTLAMASNFGRVTIYDINTRLTFKAGRVRPFVKWRYFADSPAKFWQVKAGLTYIIKE